MTVTAFHVEGSSDRHRIRIYFNDRVQERIERLDAIDVTEH